MELRALLVPVLHRYKPIAGPGGIASLIFSRLLRTNARNMVHVFRYADVAEVWERDPDFSVRGYDERMKDTTGEFILGMNEPERYGPEAEILRKAVRREDAALVKQIVAEEVAKVMARVRPTGRVDVVKDLADVVSIRFSQRYYGLEGPDPEHLLRLFQVVSWYIFSFWADEGMRRAAISASGELEEILKDIVEKRRQTGAFGDSDVLGRLLTMGGFKDGDAGIARSLAGIASGTLNAPIGLAVTSMDKLLDLAPADAAKVRELAQSAALGSDEARKTFAAYVDEAERFSVFPSVLYRHTERDVVLAAGTPRERTIPGGTRVVVWPSLAAFDKDVFESPFEFRPGRPEAKYVTFGHGRHRCLGEHIGQTLVHEMARAVFALPGIRRAQGKAGELASRKIQEASFPLTMTLEFDR